MTVDDGWGSVGWWSLALMGLLLHSWNTFASSFQTVCISLILWLSLMMIRPHFSSLNWTTRPWRWALWIVVNFPFNIICLWTVSTYLTFCNFRYPYCPTMFLDVVMICGYILIFLPNVLLTFLIIRVWFLRNANYVVQADWLELTGRFKCSLQWIKSDRNRDVAPIILFQD